MFAYVVYSLISECKQRVYPAQSLVAVNKKPTKTNITPKSKQKKGGDTIVILMTSSSELLSLKSKQTPIFVLKLRNLAFLYIQDNFYEAS